MGNGNDEKLGASEAVNSGIRDDVETLVRSGALRQVLANAFIPTRVVETIMRAFSNAKSVRSKYVSNGEVRQALERASWTGAQIDELFYSESIHEVISKMKDDALAKKIEKSIESIEKLAGSKSIEKGLAVIANAIAKNASCAHEPVSVYDSTLVCVKCGVEYASGVTTVQTTSLIEKSVEKNVVGALSTSVFGDLVSGIDGVVTTSLDLKPKTYDEKTRRAIFDALDNARSALNYLQVYVVVRGTQDARRVDRAVALVAETMAIVEGGHDWHSGG